MRFLAFLLPVAGLLAGCATVNTRMEPKVNLRNLKHVFVQRNLNENHGMDGMIVRYLKARGIDASSGPLTLMPPDATAYFTYQDQWEWDFKDTLIALNITVRNANTDRVMAEAAYMRPTAFMKTPYDMVQRTMDALFNQKPPLARKIGKASKKHRQSANDGGSASGD